MLLNCVLKAPTVRGPDREGTNEAQVASFGFLEGGHAEELAAQDQLLDLGGPLVQAESDCIS
jgi:hypothetical protein